MSRDIHERCLETRHCAPEEIKLGTGRPTFLWIHTFLDGVLLHIYSSLDE
jgi:hypothetical protein